MTVRFIPVANGTQLQLNADLDEQIVGYQPSPYGKAEGFLVVLSNPNHNQPPRFRRQTGPAVNGTARD